MVPFLKSFYPNQHLLGRLGHPVEYGHIMIFEVITPVKTLQSGMLNRLLKCLLWLKHAQNEDGTTSVRDIFLRDPGNGVRIHGDEKIMFLSLYHVSMCLCSTGCPSLPSKPD